MKKVHFIFKDGENVIYDLDRDYDLIDDFICFSIDEVEFKIRIGSECEFRRSTPTDEVILKIEDGSPKCTVKLKELDAYVEVPVLSFETSDNGKEHIIKYKLESDLDNVKSIILILK